MDVGVAHGLRGLEGRVSSGSIVDSVCVSRMIFLSCFDSLGGSYYRRVPVSHNGGQGAISRSHALHKQRHRRAFGAGVVRLLPYDFVRSLCALG